MNRIAVVVLGLMTLAGCAGVTQTPERVVLPEVARFSSAKAGETLPGGWRAMTLSRYKQATEYQLVVEDGHTVVKASADASASGLIHDINVDLQAFPVIRWRWKVNELIEGADNTRHSHEDSPVRLLVTFEGDKTKWDFSDRLFATQLRMMTGAELPYATLMYIWENRATKGTLIDNAHTSRVKMIVAESGRDRLGRWIEESRDLRADFRRAFGEEPGRVRSVAVMTDSDNTGKKSHAYYGDIAFERGSLEHSVLSRND